MLTSCCPFDICHREHRKPYQILSKYTRFWLKKLTHSESDSKNGQWKKKKQTCSFWTLKTIVLSNFSAFLHHHFLSPMILLAHITFTYINAEGNRLYMFFAHAQRFKFLATTSMWFFLLFMSAFCHALYSIYAHTINVYRFLFVCLSVSDEIDLNSLVVSFAHQAHQNYYVSKAVIKISFHSAKSTENFVLLVSGQFSNDIPQFISFFCVQCSSFFAMV